MDVALRAFPKAVIWFLRQISNIRSIIKIVDLSDVVGASPAGAAPTTSSSST